ncbi:MAG: beta-galactosidase trimerization domain-containing protein [Phycisphaerae bacterium]|nr:beta-galactosidase trimerization domain-containing protein [Phycisphaerae bacterium]
MYAHPYRTAPFRVEYRPFDRLHTREELTEMLDMLRDAGVRAWWYSVSAKGSFPLFQSKYLPYRDDADIDTYRWLVTEAHKRNIVLMSWEYLNCASMLAQRHPEWRFQFLDWDGTYNTRDEHFVCYNSPYGELLKQFCVEVTQEIGFDGLWFDGVYLFSDSNRRIACCCDFCAAKYRSETGRNIPRRVNHTDIEFRRFLHWRGNDFARYWRSLGEYVHQHAPEALIVLNQFNRLRTDWSSGNHLHRMPMPAMIASELDCLPHQSLLQHQILRAMNGDDQPTEIWLTGVDGTHPQCPDRPNPDPAGMLFHAHASATSGGFASFGFGSLLDVKTTLKTMSRALDPIAPYVGGRPIAPAGLVVSDATKDFAYSMPESPQDGFKVQNAAVSSNPVWKSTFGMHNLLSSLHIPSSVLLDNMLTEEFLGTFQAVVLPDVQCMSEESAAALIRFVENGGALVAMGLTGTRTVLGEPRDTGLLDDLFGITWRDEESCRPVMNLVSDELLRADLPDRCMISGPARLVRTNGAEVLAGGIRYNTGSRVYASQGIAPRQTEEVVGETILRVRRGKGQAIYIAQNIGHDYAINPNRRSRIVIDALITPVLNLPFTTDAPPNVFVTSWRQENRVVLHVLNVPSAILTMPFWSDVNPSPIFVEDVTPTGPIHITLPGSWKTVTTPVHPGRLHLAIHGDCCEITLDRLDVHAVIVAE